MFHHSLLEEEKNPESPCVPFRLVSPPMFLFSLRPFYFFCPFCLSCVHNRLLKTNDWASHAAATYFTMSRQPSRSALAFLPGDVYFVLVP